MSNTARELRVAVSLPHRNRINIVINLMWTMELYASVHDRLVTHGDVNLGTYIVKVKAHPKKAVRI